jgi:hypothetical protein
LDAAGTVKAQVKLWGFSDDDYGNFSRAITALSPEVKRGRWPNVKIILFFTGFNNPKEKARAIVLTPDGGTRPLRNEERHGPIF